METYEDESNYYAALINSGKRVQYPKEFQDGRIYMNEWTGEKIIIHSFEQSTFADMLTPEFYETIRVEDNYFCLNDKKVPTKIMSDFLGTFPPAIQTKNNKIYYTPAPNSKTFVKNTIPRLNACRKHVHKFIKHFIGYLNLIPISLRPLESQTIRTIIPYCIENKRIDILGNLLQWSDVPDSLLNVIIDNLAENKASYILNTAMDEYQFPEDFLEKYQDILDWKQISKYQILSEEFIFKHKDKIHHHMLPQYIAVVKEI